MSLSVLDVVDRAPNGLEIDPYVPFQAEFGGSPDSPLYWRVNTDDLNLLEIGLDPRSGDVVRVGLTQLDPARLAVAEVATPEARSGVPRVDLAPWSGADGAFSARFVDVAVDLRVQVGTDAARILLAAGESATFCRSGRVAFGMTESGALAELLLVDLSSEDIEALREAIAG